MELIEERDLPCSTIIEKEVVLDSLSVIPDLRTSSQSVVSNYYRQHLKKAWVISANKLQERLVLLVISLPASPSFDCLSADRYMVTTVSH